MRLVHMRIQQEPLALVGDCETGEPGSDAVVKVRVTLPFSKPEVKAHMLALENLILASAEKGLEIERRNLPDSFTESNSRRHRSRNDRRGRATREAQKAG